MAIPSPQDPMFGPNPLPTWVKEFRPQQWEVIEQAVELFNSGVDVVSLEAPTGTGKTLIGECIRRLMNVRCFYTCTTKALQDQFARDFPYAKVLKGRANYLTYSGNLDTLGNSRPSWSKAPSAITCSDCTGIGIAALDDDEDTGCDWCPTKVSCPFQQAKSYALASELAVLNTSYLLSDPSIGGRGLIIADEADMLEETLMGHVTLELSPARMTTYGLEPPDKKTVAASWVLWCKYAQEVILEYRDAIPPSRELSIVKERNRAARDYAALSMLITDIPKGGWVYDGYQFKDDRVLFKPVWVSDYGHEYLLNKGKKWLLMSATILSPVLMANDLGIDAAELSWDYLSVDSEFPVENRPVFVTPVASMTYKKKNESWPKMAEAVRAVCERHPNDRILVHTVSYELSGFLFGSLSDIGLDRPVVTYSNANEKAKALDAYSQVPGSVLIASSMDRGIDLPGDLCRVQVIAKVPFPNVNDKQVNKRMFSDGGTAWYRMKAIRTIIQMTGRAIRSKDDTAVTYILDAEFRENLWKSQHLFPDWWKNALRWDLSFHTLKMRF